MKSLSSHHAQYLCRPAHNSLFLTRHTEQQPDHVACFACSLEPGSVYIVIDGDVISHPEDHSLAQ